MYQYFLVTLIALQFPFDTAPRIDQSAKDRLASWTGIDALMEDKRTFASSFFFSPSLSIYISLSLFLYLHLYTYLSLSLPFFFLSTRPIRNRRVPTVDKIDARGISRGRYWIMTSKHGKWKWNVYISVYAGVCTCIFEISGNRILTDQSFDLRLCMETYIVRVRVLGGVEQGAIFRRLCHFQRYRFEAEWD